MGKFTSFQIKFVSIVLFVGVVIIIAFLLFMNSMSSVNRDINISKIESKDKIYSYNIYSDFYFNIVKYDEQGENIAQFSQFIPLRTSIGYDFSKEKPELTFKTYDNPVDLQLIANNGNAITKEIDSIKKFSKEYSLISAIQDEYYFKETAKKVKQILEDLYHTNTTLSLDSTNNFYEDIIPTVVSNIYVRVPKLDEINKNLKNLENCQNQDWCSNLIKWTFGEEDVISLEYIMKAKKIDLDDFLKEQNKNVTVTKFTKINNKQVSKFFILTPKSKNEIRSYFIDSNGYVYLLRYKYKNPISLEKYKNDYLKIAFGINFIDTTNFENKYAKVQDSFYIYKDELNKINELDSELVKSNIYEHFELKVNSNVAYNLKLEDVYNVYKNDKNYIETIRNEYSDKVLLKEALENIITISLFGRNISKLKESCNNIECVKKLKTNNWKVENNEQ